MDRFLLKRLRLNVNREKSAVDRSPWWNAGESHMNQAVPNRWLQEQGLISLLERMKVKWSSTRTAVYGTVRTVVWEDGESNFPSYPICREVVVECR